MNRQLLWKFFGIALTFLFLLGSCSTDGTTYESNYEEREADDAQFCFWQAAKAFSNRQQSSIFA